MEIEGAAMTRVSAIADSPAALGLDYVEGLRAALSAGLDHALGAIERESDRPVPIPPALLAQARLAARSGVSLDTVLRRCFVGHTTFDDFLMGEVEESSLLEEVELKCLLRAQSSLFERLMAALTEEYAHEITARPASQAERRTQLLERLLDGEPVDPTALDYDLEAHHVGLLAHGRGVCKAFEELAILLGCRLLIIPREDRVLWAWLGGERPFDPNEICRLAESILPPGACLAIGEPGKGLLGWRLTHRQARAVLPIAHTQARAGPALCRRCLACLGSDR